MIMSESKIEMYYNAFKKFAKDPTSSQLEIQTSLALIKEKFSDIFGVQNDFIATTLYYYLSNGYHDKDIKLPDFIGKFIGFSTLLSKDLHIFVHNFLDANRDGQVTLIDLIFFRYTPINTQFGREIDSAIDSFINRYIMKYQKIRPRVITIDHFIEFYPTLS